MRLLSLRLSFFFLAAMWFPHTWAQPLKSFSDDPLKFSEEIQVFFSGISSPDQKIKTRDLLNPFVASWISNEYNDKERAMVISNANDLLKQRAKPFPDFYHYISVIYGLKDRGSKDAVTIWSQDLKEILAERGVRQILAYLEQYDAIVNHNILFQSSSFTWFVTDSSIHLDYDTAIRVLYKKTDLVCFSRNDTTRIYGTDGVFYPATQKWQGRRGRVTWERFGMSADSVYADLSYYNIHLKFSEYQADSVRLTNRIFLREPIFGKLNEKVLSGPPGPAASFPRFSSYLKNYEIGNLFKDIDYFGGLSMEGARVIGSGEFDQNASLFFRKDGKIRAHIRSNAFYIREDQITAHPASLSLMLDGDSIYHPGLQMKFSDDNRQLLMFRAESGISQSPFFNAYHDIDMHSGAVYWNIDQDTINFESVPSINKISMNEFISSNFFSKYDFNRLQGIDKRNPLYVIRDFSRTYSTKEIRPDALAEFMNLSSEQVKAMLLRLSMKGLLYYDLIKDKAIIQDRLDQYIEANVGRTDYDVIKIRSLTDGYSNASLDLKNYDLWIRGVDRVFLSDSQQVYIFPDNREIVLKKGLDFGFSGVVKAGLFDIYAQECYFEYDSFRLNLPLIDSLVFQVKAFRTDYQGDIMLQKVRSVIEMLGGSLLIDHPSNKSGLQPFPEFPMLITDQESFVYYDHDPLYDRERFAYHIYPFEIKSLDNFSTDNLQFDGYLVSAGIFPNIRQALKVQPDYSLGFVHQLPAEGIPAYGGAGKYFQEISLSNRGLRGKGELSYLTSRTVSDDFLFYPEYMKVELARSFRISPRVAKVEYPQLESEGTRLVWHPYRENLHAQMLKSPALLYDRKAQFTGHLDYSPEGLSGTGKTTFENVELFSEKYLFKHHTIDADTLDFQLFTDDTGDLVVSAEKYRTHVDFNTRSVEFKTNEKGSTVSFPYNNFVCFMDNIDWDMDRKEMILFNDLDLDYEGIEQMSGYDLLKLDLKGSDFLATNPLMDSLSFFSVTARYDLTNYVIDAEDVKLIRVADAAIFPDQGDVRILKGGQIQTLQNAVIIADTTARYHLIREAEVNIISRRNFEAKGMYQYTGSGGILQEFPLTAVSVDPDGKTFALGHIRGETNFSLNPYFIYKGDVSINFGRRDLMLEGGFQTVEECFSKGGKQWVYFKAWIDPSDVRIPIQHPLVSLDGVKLDLALLMSDYDEKIYTAWFSPRAMATDTALAAASGIIFFDRDRDVYRVVSSGDPPATGKTAELLFNARSCTLETYGPISLGTSLNFVSLSSFGQVRYMAIPDSAVFNVTLAINFLFSEAALNTMADSVFVADLKGLDITGKNYLDYLEHALGRGKANELRSDLSLYGTFRRMPEELINTLLLTGVNLYWRDQTSSYVSRGPIGIASIGKNTVNRYVNGTIELIRRRSGDVITIYLELNPKQWYFFDYRGGIMQALGSDMTFNERIESAKQDKRMLSKPGLDETYEYVLSTRRRLIDFLRRIESSNP